MGCLSCVAPAVEGEAPKLIPGYGYRWEPNQAAPPNAYQIYNLLAEDRARGIYVVFHPQDAAAMRNIFARDPLDDGTQPGPVFPQAPASAAMNALCNAVNANPPPGETDQFSWAELTPQRRDDLDGFLLYIKTCLDLIYRTATGRQVIDRILQSGYITDISPSAGGPQTKPASRDRSVSDLARAASKYRHGTLAARSTRSAIRAMIAAEYDAIPGDLPKYDQLASDMNAMPLYSLFERNGTGVDGFLRSYFTFNNRRLAGADLQQWLGLFGFSRFDRSLRDLKFEPARVPVADYFMLALLFKFCKRSAPGGGCGSAINFDTRLTENNARQDPDFRPPAIGLAHELIHAMHYAAGTAPGHDIFDFTTTAAELMFVGLGPFAGEEIRENQIRTEWPTVAAAADPSNAWPNPQQRTYYEKPGPREIAGDLRTNNHI